VNFTSEPVRMRVPEPRTVEVASDGAHEGAAYEGVLARDQAVLLR
jgi:hypothetical protein